MGDSAGGTHFTSDGGRERTATRIGNGALDSTVWDKVLYYRLAIPHFFECKAKISVVDFQTLFGLVSATVPSVVSLPTVPFSPEIFANQLGSAPRAPTIAKEVSQESQFVLGHVHYTRLYIRQGLYFGYSYVSIKRSCDIMTEKDKHKLYSGCYHI